MRSTRILQFTNRMVVVPNSQIGKDQVVNYSDPDPSYYDSSDIGVAYENDIETVEQLLEKAAGSVDDVETERGIDVRLETFTKDQLIFRVGWWMKDFEDYYKLRRLVNRAVIEELKGAGVVLPYRKGRVDLAKQTMGNPSEEKNDDRD